MSRFHDPEAGRHVARYFGLTLREIGEVRPGAAEVEGIVEVGDHLRSPDGSVSTGTLLALADSVGGLGSGLAALPGWIVSTNLMLRVTPGPVAGPLVLRAETWRAGRRAVVTGVTIHDGADRDANPGPCIGDGAITTAVLEPPDGPPVYPRPLVLVPPPVAALPPVEEFIGLRRLGPDAVEIEITDALRNPWGILHGGITAALVDLAARHASGGQVTTDVVLHFLRAGRVGPVRATATRLGARPDGTVVRVEVRDRGDEDRLLALAVTTVR